MYFYCVDEMRENTVGQIIYLFLLVRPFNCIILEQSYPIPYVHTKYIQCDEWCGGYHDPYHNTSYANIAIGWAQSGERCNYHPYIYIHYPLMWKRKYSVFVFISVWNTGIWYVYVPFGAWSIYLSLVRCVQPKSRLVSGAMTTTTIACVGRKISYLKINRMKFTAEKLLVVMRQYKRRVRHADVCSYEQINSGHSDDDDHNDRVKRSRFLNYLLVLWFLTFFFLLFFVPFYIVILRCIWVMHGGNWDNRGQSRST